MPLVPNKDLIFVGAGIAAAGMAHVPVTAVATVLVILAAADLVLAATVASLAWLLDRESA
jgi:Na+/H+-dicarboxylate symporter